MDASQLPALEQVVAWAKQAGKLAMDGFGNEHTFGYKTPTDIVTEIDHQCEKLLLDSILSSFPKHSVLTEETGSIKGSDDHCWFVDPLDGTINYSHHLPIFAISIAYQAQGKLQLGVVYDPSRNECFSAERGKGAWLNGIPIHPSSCTNLQQGLLVTGFPHGNGEKLNPDLLLFGHLTQTTQGVRRLGSAALDICFVACGRIDGYWERKIHAWDIAAGALIAEESGCRVTDLHGRKEYFLPPYALIATAPGIHQPLLDTICRYQ
ncbi:MAG: inositol monophosphatase family protein [Chloroflexi bacterium]|nr:inositol monophosphatase family protein [Chloroflexota bacterium]